MIPSKAFLLTTGLLFLVALGLACSKPYRMSLATVAKVDLHRFMGDWYVIASIPTFIEKGAHDAVESYRLMEDGSIATTFTFRQGAFDGPEKRYTPKGFVRDSGSNAVWGMQFMWPVKADFRIVHLSEDYSQTVIGRGKRDFLWIMARTPAIPEADYQSLLRMVQAQGYEISRIQKVPQSPREQRKRPEGSGVP